VHESHIGYRGAAYIGSYTAKRLAQTGCKPVVLDKLWNRYRSTVLWGLFIEVDLSDRAGHAQCSRTAGLPQSFTFPDFALRGRIHVGADRILPQ
jgi:UDP-glucose 4-epimerase